MTVERLTGRAGVEDRKRILSRDGHLCQVCRAMGLTTLAEQVDHIQALDDGGSDEDDNKQAICLKCHKAKTDMETSGAAMSETPHFLRNDSNRELIVIVGPPYSGKMALAISMVERGTIIVAAGLIGDPMHGYHRYGPIGYDKRRGLMRSRNAALHSFLTGNQYQRCLLVTCAPTFKERAYWTGLAYEVIKVGYDVDMCLIAAQKDLKTGETMDLIRADIRAWR